MATIKDVAKEANVSIGTVSNVINGKTNNEELIRRVENAIEKLDFRLNGKAKSLKMKCTYLIGVVVENLENAETGLILEALERRLENEGYSLVIKMAGKNAVLEKKQISQLMKTGVDGMIIMTGNSNKKWEKLVDGSNIPVVLLDKCIMKSENISVIYIDYKRAVDRFFRWCEKNGYKKIAMILGTEVLDSESIAEIVSAHSKLQVHYRLVGNYSAEAGFKATCELLYENEVVDVIFIGNKCMESGVFQAARMLGYEEAMVSIVENMISGGCKVLVITPIDGDALGSVLKTAKEDGVEVINYDRMITNTDAVSYLATFDNTVVGEKQGEYIVDKLDLENTDQTFNLEIVSGDPGDNNATYFYNGAMSILQPYIDSGKLVVKSGQVSKDDTATANWDTEKAQSRMDAIIASYYADGTNLDAVLCSNDSTALGTANALESSYTGSWPIITGQDCDIANVKNIVKGKQTMSVFKDTRKLAKVTVKMVNSIMKGEEVEVNDTITYDNGAKVIPTYVVDPIAVDQDNYKEILIEGGYYTEAELQ